MSVVGDDDGALYTPKPRAGTHYTLGIALDDLATMAPIFGGLFSFGRKRSAKKDPNGLPMPPDSPVSPISMESEKPPKKVKPKKEKKSKEKVPKPGLLERSPSGVVHDGHELLNHAAGLLEQFGANLGSDIGFFHHRIEQ